MSKEFENENIMEEEVVDEELISEEIQEEKVGFFKRQHDKMKAFNEKHNITVKSVATTAAKVGVGVIVGAGAVIACAAKMGNQEDSVMDSDDNIIDFTAREDVIDVDSEVIDEAK